MCLNVFTYAAFFNILCISIEARLHSDLDIDKITDYFCEHF